MQGRLPVHVRGFLRFSQTALTTTGSHFWDSPMRQAPRGLSALEDQQSSCQPTGRVS